MKRHLRIKITLSALTALLACNAYSAEHVVQPGETLSGVAHDYVPGHVWGPKGSLARILELNPKYKSDADLILPSEIVVLPDSKIAENKTDRSRAPANEEDSNDKSPVVAQPNEIPVASAEKPNDPSVFHQGSTLTVSPELFFSRIDSQQTSNGASSILASSLNTGVAADWTLRWQPNYSTTFHVGILSESYQTQDSARTLDNSSFLLGEFAFDSTLRLGSFADWSIEAALKQLPFARGESPTALTIDRLNVPEASTSIRFRLYECEALYLNTILGLGFLAPTSGEGYQTKWGTDYQIKLEMGQSGKTSGAHGGFFFDSQNQNTTLTTQTTAAIGAYFGLSFDFASRKE